MGSYCLLDPGVWKGYPVLTLYLMPRPALKLSKKKPNPTGDGWKNSAVAPEGFRYAGLVQALPDIVDDYLKEGMTESALYEKYIFLTAKPFTLGSLSTLLDHQGAHAAKNALKKLGTVTTLKRNMERAAKPQKLHGPGPRAILAGHPEAVEALALQPKAEVAQVASHVAGLLKKEGEQHVRRVAKRLDRHYEVLEKTKLTPKNNLRELAALEKFNRIGRENFKLDEGQEMSPQQFQVSVLLAMGEADLKESNGTLLDLGTEGQILAPQSNGDASEDPNGYNHPPDGSERS